MFITHICHSRKLENGVSTVEHTPKHQSCSPAFGQETSNQRQGQAGPGKPRGTGSGFLGPSARARGLHTTCDESQPLCAGGVLGPRFSIRTNGHGASYGGQCTPGPVEGKKRKQQNRRKPSRPTPEGPAVPSGSLKHCFHTNTMNSVIGMPQVLGKLFS